MGFVQQATDKVEKAISNPAKAVTEVLQPIEKAVVTPAAKAVEKVVQDPIKAASDLIHDTGKNIGADALIKNVGKGVEDLGKGLGLGGGGQSSSAPTQKAADTPPATAQGIAETAIAGGEAPEAGPTKGGPDVKLRTKVSSGVQQKRRQKFGIGSNKTGVNI